MFKAINAIKLTVAWSLNCLHVIVCVAVRCPGELTKDLTLKAKANNTVNQLYSTSQMHDGTVRFSVANWLRMMIEE